ncbi:hypothetical protein ABT040_21925 [Streptomyces sp. NPDC002688]|uniref:hypothetical protein n=1 Tax=Streptomyces sp. NPDC002688 TaxID=3154423 RepID=UPI0033173029
MPTRKCQELYCIREEIAHAVSASRPAEPPNSRAASGEGTTQQKKCGISQPAISGYAPARSAAISAGSDRIPRLIAKSASNTAAAAHTVSCTRDSSPVPNCPCAPASQPGEDSRPAASSARVSPVTGSRSRRRAHTSASSRSASLLTGPATRSILCISGP